MTSYLEHFGAAIQAARAAQDHLLALRLSGFGPELDTVATDLAAAETHMIKALGEVAVARAKGTHDD